MRRLLRFQDMFFATGLNPKEAPFIIERLRGTPLRVLDLTRNLSDAQLRAKPNDEWSVFEHLDHLTAADREFADRVRQYLDHRLVMEIDPAGDIPAQTEDEPGIKDRSELQAAFNTARHELLALVESLEDEVYAHTVHFPALNQQLSLVDKLFFIAQHDDLHVAWLF